MGLPDVEQGMEQTQVSEVNLGRLDQAFSQVHEIRLQFSNNQRVAKNIQVATDSDGRNPPHGHSQRRGIEQLPMLVRQHAQKPPQSFTGNGDAQGQQVTPDQGLQVVIAPAQ